MANRSIFNWIPPTLWFLGSIAILSAIYRIFITSNALVTGLPTADPADMTYVKHYLLAAVHIIPGTIFMLLGPLQFITSIRTRWPKIHRWSGWAFITAGLVTAITAITVNLVFPPVGGLFKSLAVYIFSTYQIVALLIALQAILHRNIKRHRAWMIRSFAIGLSVSTMRLFFVPVYFMYGLPNDFTIGLGMWVGFVLNILVAEFILWREPRYTQRTASNKIKPNRYRMSQTQFAAALHISAHTLLQWDGSKTTIISRGQPKHYQKEPPDKLKGMME